jgi:hypothetical protein
MRLYGCRGWGNHPDSPFINSVAIDAAKLKKNFNSWARDVQFILGDEVTGSDRRADADLLKNFVTQHELHLDEKYLPVIVIPDRINWYFTSNHPDAAFMDDDDRRYHIVHAGHEKLPESFYRAYDKWMWGDGPAYLFHHLLSIDTRGFNPLGAAFDTNAKQNMIRVGKSDLGSFVSRLKEDPTGALRALGNQRKAERCALFTSDELLRAYDPEHATGVKSGGMGKALSRTFNQVLNGRALNESKKPDGLPRSRFWAIRDDHKWLKADEGEIRAHLRQFLAAKY